jgi:hypothetical protein
MRFSTIASTFFLAAAVSAQQNITVIVGANGGLTYNPSSATAKTGDTIAFQFQAKNHTVTQSTFADPCAPVNQGVDSGFQPVPTGATSFPQWSFTLNNDSAPLWFFCKQTGHCAQGMVFALNPTQNKTFDAFKANAMSTSSGNTASASGAGGSPTSSSTAKPSASNGAMRVAGSAAGIVTLVGLVAGLAL